MELELEPIPNFFFASCPAHHLQERKEEALSSVEHKTPGTAHPPATHLITGRLPSLRKKLLPENVLHHDYLPAPPSACLVLLPQVP